MTTSKAVTSGATSEVETLQRIKTSFGAEFADEKISIITKLSKATSLNAKQLISYHESLCFLRAYADNAALLKLVEDELGGFHERVKHFKAKRGEAAAAHLDETGIAGTELHHPYGYLMSRWLVERFPEAADLDWLKYLENDDDPILTYLPLLVSWCENDAIDDPDLPTGDIIEAAIGKRKVTKLAWFVEMFERLEASDLAKRLIYDQFELPLVIKIGNQSLARTNLKMTTKNYYFQKRPLSKEYPDLVLQSKRRDLKPRLLATKAAEEIIDVLKQALVMRHRELYPLTFANHDEVYGCDIGRGMKIYVIGMTPEMRLPLESNYSAMLVRNGVPIGYGIGAMVFERIEIAINIFETYRGSEAGFIFGKFTQLFHQMFGVSYMMIRKYQVGHDNDEGLQSGSYWFYYKLGFRSIKAHRRQLAEEEIVKIRGDRGYRTPRSILRRLANSDMCLDLRNPANFESHDIPLGKIALLQTKYIAEHFNGDRNRAEREAPRIARRLLGARNALRWTKSERLWFNRLSILICAIPEIADWNERDKKRLAALMRAKGSAREQAFVRLMASHGKFKDELSASTGS